MTEQATVLIVDDDPAIRNSLSLLMEAHGIQACCYDSGRALVETPLPEGAACVLLDLHMPDMDGLEVQKALKQQWPNLPVIFLTGYGDVPVAVQVLKHGAIDFFQKPDFNRQALIETIEEALTTYRDNLTVQTYERQIRKGAKELSPRERQVALAAAAGKANKVIGIELGISERTVEVHRGRVMKKLGLRRAAELVKAEKIIAEVAGD